MFYLCIKPDNTMLQLSLYEDETDLFFEIMKLKKGHRINPEVFKKHKEKCTKKEFETLKKEAIKTMRDFN